ncbi:rod shape-determining protein MreD [Zongyangia hominis]|uniref:Rod shape-determining protein MreD n=1 Tax=Zongyangia hominis TaxID=2763677 RepID=A0A926EGE2_9FIRM|nr:rod shape-determining protein MreD [Zongyangia hominis]MBC8571346.1 rod shape-determining protein MreD [Zongyangia hominis]
MQQKKIYHVLKWGIYLLLVLFCYVLQTTTSLFVVFGVKPLLLVPLVVCIAMFEGEFSGAIFGALAGLYCDLGAGQLFGSNGLVLMLCCFAAGLLVHVLMRPTLTTCLILSGGTLVVRGFFDFFFNLALWDYDGISRILLTSILPVILYSLIVTPLFYYFIRKLSNRFVELLAVE